MFATELVNFLHTIICISKTFTVSHILSCLQHDPLHSCRKISNVCLPLIVCLCLWLPPHNNLYFQRLLQVPTFYHVCNMTPCILAGKYLMFVYFWLCAYACGSLHTIICFFFKDFYIFSYLGPTWLFATWFLAFFTGKYLMFVYFCLYSYTCNI